MDARSGGLIQASPGKVDERAWRDYLRSGSLNARRCGLTGTILKSRMPQYFPQEDGW